MSEKTPPKSRPSKKGKLDRENDAQLSVWIDAKIEKALRQKLADDNTTKRQVVEEALRKLLGVEARSLA